METRNISLTLEEAKQWYNSDNEILKALALQAFDEKELMFNFRNIKTFGDACRVFGFNYVDVSMTAEDIRRFSKASAAMFKLNIIRKALNLGQDLNLTKDPKDSCIYCPLNPFVIEGSSYYRRNLETGEIKVLGKIKTGETIYTVLGGNAVKSNARGLGCFVFHSDGAGYTYTSVGLLGCATEEIAKHFGKYFGMLITEAKYGDLPDFKIIENKYQ